jgi:hypothetical protein
VFEVANHAHPEALPDPESYEYTFVVNAGEAVFIPMGWIHRVESDEGTIAIAHEIQDAMSIEFIHNTVSRLDYPWDESLYLVRRKIESKIDWKFTSLVAELIDSKNEEIKTRAKITHENVAYIKSKCEEGKEVEFEITNPEQLMENVSQSCAILVDGGKEEGIDDEIPKYRKDVLAMNPLQAKLHTLQLSLLKDYLGESKFEKWIGDCSLKYAESRGPEWKRVQFGLQRVHCEHIFSILWDFVVYSFFFSSVYEYSARLRNVLHELFGISNFKLDLFSFLAFTLYVRDVFVSNLRSRFYLFVL